MAVLRTSCRHVQISYFPVVKPVFPFCCNLNLKEYLLAILNSWSHISPQRDFVLFCLYRTKLEARHFIVMDFSLSPSNATHCPPSMPSSVVRQTLPICELKQYKEQPPFDQPICVVCRDAQCY